jgi:hypothetical protein
VILCRGHVPVSDSHYLHAALGSKVLGAYYLGCPMRHTIKEAFKQLIHGYKTIDFIPSDTYVTKVFRQIFKFQDNFEFSMILGKSYCY